MHRRARGLTLIETLLVLAVAALLAGLAWPGYAEQHRRGHRADAIARLAEVEQRQERWRSQNPAYATAAEIAVPAIDRYAFAIDDAGPTGYRLTAQARGAQAGDAACAWLELVVRAGEIERRSGASDALDNDAAANARCWLR